MKNLDILLPFGLFPTGLANDLLYQLRLPSLSKLIARTKNIIRQKQEITVCRTPVRNA